MQPKGAGMFSSPASHTSLTRNSLETWVALSILFLGHCELNHVFLCGRCWRCLLVMCVFHYWALGPPRTLPKVKWEEHKVGSLIPQDKDPHTWRRTRRILSSAANKRPPEETVRRCLCVGQVKTSFQKLRPSIFRIPTCSFCTAEP